VQQNVDRILKKHRAKDAPFLAAALQIIHLAHAVKGFKPVVINVAEQPGRCTIKAHYIAYLPLRRCDVGRLITLS